MRAPQYISSELFLFFAFAIFLCINISGSHLREATVNIESPKPFKMSLVSEFLFVRSTFKQQPLVCDECLDRTKESDKKQKINNSN